MCGLVWIERYECFVVIGGFGCVCIIWVVGWENVVLCECRVFIFVFFFVGYLCFVDGGDFVW